MTRQPEDSGRWNRRAFLAGLAGASALSWGGRSMDALARPVRPTDFGEILTKPIPSTSEAVPVVGMGTWITFNVGDDQALRDHRTGILREFFRRGGRMIDCSPMYGSSAEVLGYGLSQLETTDGLFSASKVWTSWTSDGPEQMGEQRRLWGVDGFDLMQVHNLKNWEGHLETLREMKADGQIRYIGVTTSHGRRHDELIHVMETHDLDFIQVTYNILDRAVEDRILPLAQDRGMAVIANRPYRQKGLFRLFQDKPLPPWAEEQADAVTWADFFLKFIVSHPAVTCAIPATSQLPHLRENMAAATGRLPDAKTRARMAQYLETL